MALTYASLADLKTALGITVSTQDAWLTAILEGVEANINTYLGFDPTVTDITEFCDARSTQHLYLRRSPVTEVTAVWQDVKGYYGSAPDAFPTANLLVEGEQWVRDKDRQDGIAVLLRINSLWPSNFGSDTPDALTGLTYPCWGCVKVHYTIDNSYILTICSQAAMFEGIARYRSTLTGMGPVTSDSMDGAGVSVSNVRRNPYNERPDPRDSFFSPMISTMLHQFCPAESYFV